MLGFSLPWKKRVMRKFTLLLLLTLISGSAPSFSVAFGQKPSIRQHIQVLGMRGPCDPAEVVRISLGKQPPKAVLAQVSVQSNSDNPISAVTLSWRTYAARDGAKIRFTSCESRVTPPAALASGVTRSIPIAFLQPRRTVTIGIKPLPVIDEFDPVFIERPLIMVEELKPLRSGDSLVSPGEFMLLVFVSEIRYMDGSSWSSKI